MLKLEWLEAFAAFAEHESFTRAARALHLSQPALHVQVKKLSEALSVTLYRREGQRLVLTADGLRVAALAREVREHDPKLALDGGGDGLEAYRGLAPEIARLLASDGRFFVEIGRGQGDDVRAIFAAAGLAPIISRRDLAGVERVVGGRLASGEPGAETDARDS